MALHLRVAGARGFGAAILYLVGIAAAEAITTLANPTAGVILDLAMLLALVAHATVASSPPSQRFYLALALAPLIRILSLMMPLAKLPLLYWYAMIGLPLIVATFWAARSAGYSWANVGLTLGRGRWQPAIAIAGLPLGIAEYVILKP